ncbi:MAG: hypothetical protein IH899_12250, partial [Planctomycetes bacterium]|nr:hypothetical protein [Planctomycetota bacterium]
SSALKILDEKIAQVREKFEQAKKAIELAKAEIQCKAEVQRDFDMMLIALIDVREKIAKEAGQPASLNGDMGPKQAILTYLEINGLSDKDTMLDELETKVQSKSVDKRETLYQTLFTLKKSGKVVRAKNGKFNLPTA